MTNQTSNTGVRARRVTTTDTTPGQNHVDTTQEQLEAVREVATNIPTDEFGTDLRPAAIGACNALVSVRAFLWAQADLHHRSVRGNEAFVRATAEAEVKNLGNSQEGWSPVDLQAARAGKLREVQARAAASARNAVLSDQVPEAATLAANAVASLTALQDAVQAAVTMFMGPSALSDTVTLASLGQQAALQSQIRAMAKPMAESMVLFASLVKQGKDEKAKLFMTACRDICVETKNTPAPKLAARLGNGARADAVESELSGAYALLRAFDKYRESQTPESITSATACLQGLKEVFATLLGVRASAMSQADFQRKYLSGSKLRPDPTFALDADWRGRFLSPSPYGTLSGWSPQIARTGLGAIVRAPRGE